MNKSDKCSFGCKKEKKKMMLKVKSMNDFCIRGGKDIISLKHHNLKAKRMICGNNLEDFTSHTSCDVNGSCEIKSKVWELNKDERKKLLCACRWAYE